MPTVSEPLWKEQAERIAQAVLEFIVAKPGSVDDSEAVFRARLFGLGLRGQDLNTEVSHAQVSRFERRCCPLTKTECPLGGGCVRCQRK